MIRNFFSPPPRQTTAKDKPPHGRSSRAIPQNRPPLHTRFKPGQRVNRNGRPKRHRNVRTILEEVLNQKVKIRVGGRTRLCTNLEAFVMTLANDSITREAKAKAQASLIGLMRWAGMMGEVSEAADSEPFTANDKVLIEDFLRRRSAAFVQPDGSDGNGGSTAKSKGVAS